MRLTDWRALAPHPTSLGPKVEAVLVPILTSLGAEPDPECWIMWGDDPAGHWMTMAPTDAGLAVVTVRVFFPQEGPRASGRLVRWHRVQVGDFQVETQANHRMLTFQIEGQILRAVDEDVDALAAFIRRVFAGMDGRPLPAASPTASEVGERPADTPR